MKENISYIFIILFIILTNKVYSQTLTVQQFNKIDNDKTVDFEKHRDMNGDITAFIRIKVDDRVSKVEGSFVGNVENKGDDYGVFVQSGCKSLKFFFNYHQPLYISFHTYNIKMLEGGCSYLLVLRDNQEYKDYDRMPLSLLKSKAKQGDAKAQFYVGMHSIANNDSVYGVQMLESSAKQGDSDAAFYLGKMYKNGFKIKKDIQKSLYWLQQSSNKGNAEAQLLLGLIYFYGDVVKADYSKSIELFSESYSNNNQTAKIFLGMSYYFGYGVEINKDKAFECFKTGVLTLTEKDMQASIQFLLGQCYSNGEGTPQDYKKAFVWYSLSAENGDVDGMCCLGYCYKEGYGITIDLSKAKYWLEKAASQGSNEAKEQLKQLNEK